MYWLINNLFPKGVGINMATSYLPSQGPLVRKDQHGYITPAFSGSPRWGQTNRATSPPPSRDPDGGERPIWLHRPCLLGFPMVRRKEGWKMGKIIENGQKWVTIQRIHIQNA